jgi:predicted dehydrogenase
MPKTIKVAIITQQDGAHLPDYFGSLAKVEEVASVSLVDPSGRSEAAARKALGTRFHRAYRDRASMLKEYEPQLAVVSLEAANAPPAIDAALEAGCHVFAEKPSCTKAADFEKLVRKAEAKHQYLMMAFANRSHAPVREARRLIKAGKLGRIYGAEVHLITDQTRLKSAEYRKSWFCIKARAGGGQLTWVGIHWLDLLLYVSGLRIKDVAGFAGVVGGQPLDIEDSAALSLRFDNGGHGTMLCGYYLDRGYHSHVKIWGESGWLQLAAVEEQPLEWYSTRDTREPKVERFTYKKGERGYFPFMRACVRASAGLEDPPISGAEALHVLRSIFAFYEAARTGRSQSIG